MNTASRETESPATETTKPPVVLHTEPTEDILLLGEMLVDSKTMADLLKGLVAAGEGYHGNLRVIRGAAVRMAERCKRLLGE